ncbi:MAG: S41 family peptidase [Campylobacterota bacterium]|nr:S41 family peptidase [Campylobacterota bacterium]
MLKKIVLFITILLLTSCASQKQLSKKDTISYIIQSNYYKELNSTILNANSHKDILKHLDSHSKYLTSTDLEKFLTMTSGKFGGIGISLHIKNKLLTVISTILNSPAKDAGIKHNDIIIQINGTSTLGLSLEKCISLTKGKVGTFLNLTILRKNNPIPILFSIKREYINMNPIFFQLIDNSLLYINIPTYNATTSRELQQILHVHSKRQGIILDLRYNPGGILREAISNIDMFLNKGFIVKQKGRFSKYTVTHNATDGGDTTTPLVILINHRSASASEIVAGTLQYYKRATVIGEKSFGKGSVQTLFPIDYVSALKLTIAKYYLANGLCIDKIGITPNIIIKNKNYKIKNKNSISYDYVKSILLKLNQNTLIPIKSSHTNYLSTSNNILSSISIKNDSQLTRAIQFLKNNN